MAHLSFGDARQRLAELTARMEEVNKTADVPSRLAHYLARRNLGKGLSEQQAIALHQRLTGVDPGSVLYGIVP